MREQEKKDDGPRSFTVFLAQCEDGQLNAELSAQLQRLATTMARHAEHYGAAKGTFSLALSLSMDAMGTTRVKADFKTKEPKAGRLDSTFWLNPSHNFVNENPKQTKLALREVPAPGPARDVGIAERDAKGV